jgi:hypothetical protein
MAIASAVRREHTEGQIAKSIESQTAKLPSDTFLWAAITAIGASATLQMMGKQSASVFVGPVGADAAHPGTLQQAGEAASFTLYYRHHGRLRRVGLGGIPTCSWRRRAKPRPNTADGSSTAPIRRKRRKLSAPRAATRWERYST